MSDAQALLFGAVLAQVLLTFVLYLMLVRVRFAVAADKANLKPEMAYDQAAWPPHARKISNAVISQFELPALFYVGVLFAFHFGAAGWLAAILAWIFVASRIVHAAIHTGRNVVMQRFAAFLVGFAAMLVFWIALAIHVWRA